MKEYSKDQTINVAMNTVDIGKQGLVFVSSRASAEKTAEEISKKIKEHNCKDLAEKILKAIPTPTKQCRRLSKSIEKGIAFHHAGLHMKQRELIEDEFRSGRIKIICATPTLAYGVDTPAFRAIIRDLHRFSNWGMQLIPVLDFQQMCVSGETKVITSIGNITIKEIVEQKLKIEILTYNESTKSLEFKPITKYYKQKVSEIYTIKSTLNNSLKITGNHEIYTGNWTKTKNIKKNDQLHYPNAWLNNNYTPNLFDLADKSTLYVENKGNVIKKLKKLGYLDKKISSEFKIPIKHIYHYKLNRKRMPYKYYKRICKKIKINNYVKKLKTRYGNNIILKNIDADFMWLIGLIASDGNLQKTIDKRSGSTYCKIRVFNKNKRIINKARKIMKQYVEGSPYLNLRSDGLYSLEIGSTLLADIINKNFGIPFGNKTTTVKVPKRILDMPIYLRASFIAGVFDGDGNFSRNRILICSASKNFSKGLQEILDSLNVRGKIETKKIDNQTILKNKKVHFNKTVYNVIIQRKIDIQNFSLIVKPIKQKIQAKYSTYNKMNEFYENKLVLKTIKVKSAEKSKGEYDVYNLGVIGNNNYFANNVLVHNCGRAGRPGQEFGEAICVAKNAGDVELITEKFFRGKPETIYSKLAVEPVFRTYLLSLIAMGFVSSKEEILKFFGKTFYAHQYKDMEKMSFLIDKMLMQLEQWKFIISNQDEFKSADEMGSLYRPTLIGKRVAELYLDPYTANFIIESIERTKKVEYESFSFTHMIASTLEIRPYLRVKAKEFDNIQEEILLKHDLILVDEPSLYEPAHDEFFDQFKTALFMNEWMDEKDDEYLLEKYNIRPGEIRVKLSIADWLLYSSMELARIKKEHGLLKEFSKLRLRLKNGAKEELLPLLQLKEIGRVRARKLFNSRFKTIEDLKRADLGSLKAIIGEKTAMNVKEQLGQKVDPVSKGKRVGQTSINKY